jgi:hypothetical protein
MKTQDPLAQALDACLERMRADGLDAHAALSACPEGALDAGSAEQLAPILDLAIALDALPKIPAPDASFRARLAAELAAAPMPRSLAQQRTSPAAGHLTSDLVLALDGGLEAMRNGGRMGGHSGGQGHNSGRSGGRDGGLGQSNGAGGQVNGHALLHPIDGISDEAELAFRPDLVDEIEPLLELAAALEALPAVPGPSDAFRARLAAEIAAAPTPRSIQAQRAPAGFGFFRRLWRSTAFTAAAAATVVMFLASGVVYASANALPDHPLYRVKRATEQMQLWLAADDAVELHLALAGRRLHEALVAGDQAGALLADFNHEVTAALVSADRRLSARVPRAQVAEPLLAWLIGARVELVGGRPKLPPMAWRASLALVDEAIAALQSGDPLTVAPVPRLGHATRLLAKAAPGEIPRLRTTARLLAPAAIGGSGATGGIQPSGDPSNSGTNSRGAAAARGALPPVGGASGPAPVAVAPPAAVAPESPVVPPSGSTPDDPDEPNEPTTPPEQRGLPPSPDPTVEPPPTDIPSTPTTEPTTEPPTATPTELPPVNKAPVITAVSCSPNKLPSNSEATCTVDVTDPEGEPLTYAWSVNPLHSSVSPKNERETRLTVFYPGSGYEPLELTIRISVTDSAGNTTNGSTVVVVVPFLQNGP